ncbi:MAG: tRNA-dihydrouridine synthase family protein [Nanoarchaeota archaeon]
MKPLSIGPITLKNRLFLAPMVDVTDLPYRLICREQGAAMAYTEMLNIGAILHTNKKTQDMLKTTREDKPSGVQITGPRVSEFKKVVPFLRDFDIVDINCGCPSVRITDNASGSYLLKTPHKIVSYIRVLKDAGYTTTAKIRLGFSRNNALRVAKVVEHAGADALTVHARLSTDSYKVPADWKWIASIKKEIGIPVIGNGDIDSGEKAVAMLDVADGAMVARAAMGDPRIFSRILYYLKTGKEKDKREDVKKNLGLFEQYMVLAQKHEVLDMARVKFLGGHFIAGFNGAAAKRAEFMRVKTIEDAREFVQKLL